MGTWFRTSDYYDFQANHIACFDTDPPEKEWLSVLTEKGIRWLMTDDEYNSWLDLGTEHNIEKQGKKEEVLKWVSDKPYELLWRLK